MTNAARYKAQRFADNPNAQSIEVVLDLCGQLSALAPDSEPVGALVAAVQKWAKERRDRRILDNTGLVHGMVGSPRFRKQLEMAGIPLDDAAQEGMIGLQRAAELFDESRGLQFSTYATNWIFQSLRRMLPSDRTIPIPAHVYEHKEHPSIEHGRRAMRIRSLDGIGTKMDKGDLFAGQLPARPEEDWAERIDRHDLVTELMSVLSSRDREILRLRYEVGLTLLDTAQALAQSGVWPLVTRERLRQIEAQILERMRAKAEGRPPDRRMWLNKNSKGKRRVTA